MSNQNERETFSYTYSAKQQEEIKSIRQKYMAPEENKMDQIRKMDAAVTMKATIVSIVVGMIGALIFGVGMCCTMVWTEVLFVQGVVIGLVGIAILAAAYPLYMRVLRKEREKIAPEILRLTEELMK